MSTILVTGATGGMGSMIVSELTENGHAVITHDVRSTDALVPDVTGDLMDPAVLAELAQRSEDAGVSGVIAAHGIAGAAAIAQTDLALTTRLMSINTLSVITLFDALEARLHTSAGAFVAISSQAGLVAEAGNGMYCASKFALVGWAKEKSRRSPVPLRLLCPGATHTPLLMQSLQGQADARGVSYEHVLQEFESATPAGRFGEPAELARAARWLVELSEPSLVIAPVTGGQVLA